MLDLLDHKDLQDNPAHLVHLAQVDHRDREGRQDLLGLGDLQDPEVRLELQETLVSKVLLARLGLPDH